MHGSLAAVIWQIERCSGLESRRYRGKDFRHDVWIAVGPHQNRSLRLKVGKIDPGCAARRAVDQNPWLRVVF
jgi:hypothetical protein